VTTFFKIAYQPYKWIVVMPMIFLFTMILGLVCIVAGIVLKQDAANHVAVLWSKLCCAIIPLKVSVKGRKNYTKNQAYVIVSNHQSMVDIPALHGNLGLKIKWIMKKELGSIPIFGPACRYLGCITVDRKNHDAAMQSIEDAKATLTENACVLFFAEGTRSRDGKVMPFKKGAFRFAYETNLPILPVTIRNSFHVFPPDSLDLIPGTVNVVVHRPIHIKAYHLEHLDDIICRTRAVISSAL
jgi:1-acyl-sn-glycerol-3-phosphate acyltransferase